MSTCICKCCGEPIGEKGDAHSLNPNVCASCSSPSDGVPESSMSSFSDFADKTLEEVDFHPESHPNPSKGSPTSDPRP